MPPLPPLRLHNLVYIQNLSTGEITTTRPANVANLTAEQEATNEKTGKPMGRIRGAERLLTPKECKELVPVQEEITRLVKVTQSKRLQNFGLARREVRGKMQSPEAFLKGAPEMLRDPEMGEGEQKWIHLIASWIQDGYDVVEPAAKRIAELWGVLRTALNDYLRGREADFVESRRAGIRSRAREEKLAEIELQKELDEMEAAAKLKRGRPAKDD